MNQTVPFYDFPQSPILIIGFFGILTAMLVLYVANRKYFNSPFNEDNQKWDSWDSGTFHLTKWPTIPYNNSINKGDLKKMNTYTLNKKQDAVLIQMLRYFNELGVGGDMNQEDFDSLVDLVCNNGDDVVKARIWNNEDSEKRVAQMFGFSTDNEVKGLNFRWKDVTFLNAKLKSAI